MNVPSEDTFSGVLMFFRALTPVHAGAGPEVMSPIDLPIQREKHTGWPTIYGSSIKGALRSFCKNVLKLEEETIKRVFGPEPGSSEKETGAISFSDARILLFPVKSASKVFVWITCPLALMRLVEDITAVGLNLREDNRGILNINKIKDIKKVLNNYRAVVIGSEAQELEIYLEEIMVKAKVCNLCIEDLAHCVNISEDILRERLVIVSDSLFSSFVRNATQVIARVRLNDKKVVVQGALWYEEYLPPETVMYSLIQKTLVKLEENVITHIN
ncbi:MAG: type III-B CRISPR module RAMP protein Cmr4, partial [Euryarchaeota archaeon]|nr:type III-B CRISPR module RAMP protein Cmr4 [Euryarchaeota archaeon]